MKFASSDIEDGERSTQVRATVRIDTGMSPECSSATGACKETKPHDPVPPPVTGEIPDPDTAGQRPCR